MAIVNVHAHLLAGIKGKAIVTKTLACGDIEANTARVCNALECTERAWIQVLSVDLYNTEDRLRWAAIVSGIDLEDEVGCPLDGFIASAQQL